MQLPRSMEAVRRTIDGRTDARRRRNGSLRLPELSVARVDHGIALVVPIRMVPYKVALSDKTPDDFGVRFCILTHGEKRALHTVTVQRIGDT